jgi:hypothetical protein
VGVVSKGQWTENSTPWHDTRLRHCQVCGKLITRLAWLFPAEGGFIEACGPGCEHLYHSYLLPTHGAVTPARTQEST